MPSPRARLTVDLDALAANYAYLKTLAPHTEIAPVVKADGYGLGADPVARRLWAEGARSFFVARTTSMHPSCLPMGQCSLRTRASPPGQT